jgi:two-component system nitrogen regulation sensor histidine kinase GlnL
MSPVAAPGAVDLQRLAGLDLLATAVLVIDWRGTIAFANQAAEQLFEASRKHLTGQTVQRLFTDNLAVEQLLQDAQANALGMHRQLLDLRRPLLAPVTVQATASALDSRETPLLLELAEIEQQLKVDRDERVLDLTAANRHVLRNLAHEVKNPLGGIRGAAQLLERELASEGLREYTRVIVAEADRLQALVDRLLAPHRTPRVVEQFNIHEVCERVRAVLLAEFPQGLAIDRDYDASAPEVRGDREQLIQALLNVARNAAQALDTRIEAGDARIELRTRVARRVAIARRVHRLALALHVIDNGPGVPDELRERVFYPLVSGREGGSGLGLSLAQTYVQSNDGAIEFDSRPGHTDFRIVLPL